jgi:membrane fusion protein (multidrug efflux system)
MAVARKESVEARIDEARSAIALANLNLSFTEVRAPFDGVIDRIPFKTGSLVSEGELLTTLSDNREVFAYFNVSEKEFFDLAKRDSTEAMKEVQLMMANNEMFGPKGRIETVESVIDRGTGNIAFRARFANPGGILKHGASGRILVSERLRGAMVIPQKSTFEIQDRTYVYTVDSANAVRVRNFTPRLRLPHLFVVESGLSANDRVLYEGIQQVRDGMKIKAKDMAFRDAKFD